MKKPGGRFTKCLKIFFNLFYLFFLYTEYNYMSKIDHSLNLCNCFPTAQPAGIPEILKKSLHSCSVRGGEEVFIIGKNFLKDTKVIFQENVAGEANFCHLPQNLHRIVLFSAENILLFVVVPDENSWKAEAEIDMELFHQVDCECIFYRQP